MDRSLNSELNVLANHLSRIALADRHTCDFTVKSLRDALTVTIGQGSHGWLSTENTATIE